MEPWLLALLAAVMTVSYASALVIYRLFFHPLRDFPGPYIARATFKTEFYWDVLRRGQYIWRLQEWHAIYGPVIRISPDELHVSDPEFYDVIYAGTSAHRKIDKWWKQSGLFGTSQSTFGTANHDLHRARRAPVATLFNRKAVQDLQPLIKDKLNEFMSHMAEYKGTGTPVNLYSAFGALTGDIISYYAFGESMGLIPGKDFSPDWHALMRDTAWIGAVSRQFNFLWPLMKSIPTSILTAMNPSMDRMISLNRMTMRKISELERHRQQTGKAATVVTRSRRTIFDEMLDSDLPDHEKAPVRLGEEADSIIGAGTVTTADALAALTFHVLQNPRMLARLKQELKGAVLSSDGLPRFQDLEPLPYLTAILKEALRMYPGVVARLPRIQPNNRISCHGWVIPPGTPVSMSTYTLHYNPDLFPEPKTFNPDRWLTRSSSSVAPKLDNYLVPFGKGTRQCLGLTLAWAELYLTVAALFGQDDFKLELFRTTRKDLEVVADGFNPAFTPESKGVRVLVC